MRNILPGFVTGVIFGAGLAVSDLVNPARVLAFLDIAGAWDPTLAIVMAAALVPSALGYAALRRMQRPIMAERFCVPEKREIDASLLAGSLLFGVGWGLAGFCPGPAVAGLALDVWQAWIFFAAMVIGMILHRITSFPRQAAQTPVLNVGG